MYQFAFVLLFPVAILIWKGIRIVPQGEEWVVERLGKFSHGGSSLVSWFFVARAGHCLQCG